MKTIKIGSVEVLHFLCYFTFKKKLFIIKIKVYSIIVQTVSQHQKNTSEVSKNNKIEKLCQTNNITNQTLREFEYIKFYYKKYFFTGYLNRANIRQQQSLNNPKLCELYIPNKPTRRIFFLNLTEDFKKNRSVSETSKNKQSLSITFRALESYHK